MFINEIILYNRINKLILNLLFGAEVVSVSTLGLPAVGCTRMETSIALAADHFLTVVLHGQDAQRWLNGA